MAVRQVYFLSKTEEEANVANKSIPLAINSTGIEYYYEPFNSSSFRYDYSFVYVRKGCLLFEMDNIFISLKEGEMIIIPPETYVKFGTDEYLLSYNWLQFTGFAAKKLLDNVHFSVKTKYRVAMCDEAEKLIVKIFNEFIIRDEFFSIKTAAIFTEFFVLLSRNLYENNRHLMKSLEYIRRHYYKTVSISELAKLEHVSPAHYRTIFKKFLGVSPVEYISNVRLNMACHYLTNTTYSISEISQKIGYSDPLYFSRIFRKKMGITASGYRNAKSINTEEKK